MKTNKLIISARTSPTCRRWRQRSPQTTHSTMKLTIYWVTKDESIRARIRKRFGIPWGMTVNKETKVEIRDEDMDLLRETEKRGFIQIRFKKR